MNIENFFPVRNREILQKVGLHKVAGAMAGIDEVTIKEAVAILGAKAYLRRGEMRKIADGIQAIAELQGEKLAEGLGAAILQRALFPALGGMAIAAVPKIMSGESIPTEDLVLGGVLGGAMGAGHGLYQGSRINPNAATQMGEAMMQPQRLPPRV